MKKIVKIFLIVFLCAFLSLAAFAVFVRFFLTPERIKQVIETQASSFLHRQVQLGKISVGLFSGLEILDFKLSEQPDFSKGTFISSERFQLHLRWFPLLAKKIMIKEVEVVQPQINVVRSTDGKTFNFSDLTSNNKENSTPATPEKPGSVSAVTFLITKATVKQGKVQFTDLSPSHQSCSIDPLNFTARNFTLNGAMDLQSDLTLIMKGVNTRLDFVGIVNVFKGNLKIKKGEITSDSSKILLTGEASDLKEKSPMFDMKVTLDKLQPSLFRKWGLKAESIPVQNPISGTIDVKGTLASLQVPAIELKTGSLTLSGKGNVQEMTSSQPRFDFAINTNVFPANELKSILPKDTFPPELALAGNLSLATTIKGDSSHSTISAQIDGSPMELVYGSSFKKPIGHALLLKTEGNLSTTPLSFKSDQSEITLGEARIQGNLRFNSLAQKNEYFFDGKSNEFSVEDILKTVPANVNPKLKGKATLDFKLAGINNTVNTSGELVTQQLAHEFFGSQTTRLNWNLNNVSGDGAQMTGSATLFQEKANVKNIQKLTNDVKMARTLLLPITLLQKLSKATGGAVRVPAFDAVSYSELIGDYTFNKGTMTIKKFNIVGGDLNSSMTGTMGITEPKSLNLKAQLVLPSDQQNSPRLQFSIRGTVDDPHISLDLSEIKNKTINELKSGLGDFLRKKLSGSNTNEKPVTEEPGGEKPVGTSGEQSNSTDTSQEKKPEKQIEDLLKGLFKKK